MSNTISAILRGATIGTVASFPNFYRLLLAHLLSDKAHVELNERTGERIAVSPTPVHFNLDLSDLQLPMCGVRRTFPRTAAAEVAWFVLGSKDVSFVREYAPIWDKFVEEDGTTVAGAYGHRWREHFGRDQLADAIVALRRNTTDRRVFVSAWDPGQDGLGRPSKNVPCPVGFTLSVVGGHLNSALLIRSSDTFVGLPYDVMGHSLLLMSLACSIGGVLPGVMSVTLAHPHLYLKHEEMAREALGRVPCTDTRTMPPWSVEQIEEDPHGYVQNVRLAFKDMPQPAFHCRPELIV